MKAAGSGVSPRPLYTLLLVWAALALGAGAWGMVASSPVPPPAILGGLTAAGLVAYLASGRLKAWVRAVPLGALVALHLIRFVGVWFIVLYRRGELPFAFAVPGGLGRHPGGCRGHCPPPRGDPRPDARPARRGPGVERARAPRYPLRRDDSGLALHGGPGAARSADPTAALAPADVLRPPHRPLSPADLRLAQGGAQGVLIGPGARKPSNGVCPQNLQS